MADCIDRQDAIDAIWKVRITPGGELFNAIKRAQEELIKQLPSAESERKKGKWIWDDEGYHCSECWFHAHGNTLECMDGTYRFCPNCGALMWEEDDET